MPSTPQRAVLLWTVHANRETTKCQIEKNYLEFSKTQHCGKTNWKFMISRTNNDSTVSFISHWSKVILRVWEIYYEGTMLNQHSINKCGNFFFFFFQTDGASLRKVCLQQGYPVYLKIELYIALLIILHLPPRTAM